MQSHKKPTGGNIESLLEGEIKLVEVKRHPLGILVLYLEIIFTVLAGLGLMFFLSSDVTSGSASGGNYSEIFVIAAVLIISIAAIILLAGTYIYWQNRLIISDKNLTEILQHGLFSRQVTELSMANVEDVSADKKGIFQTVFNYGDLLIQTAGAQNKLRFAYCPNPGYYGKIILEARQKYIEKIPESARRANHQLHLPHDSQQHTK